MIKFYNDGMYEVTDIKANYNQVYYIRTDSFEELAKMSSIIPYIGVDAEHVMGIFNPALQFKGNEHIILLEPENHCWVDATVYGEYAKEVLEVAKEYE